MEAKTVRRDTVSSQSRGDQLRAIMQDAVQNVLERPETRRGPYIIDNIDLQLNTKQA